MTRDPDPIGLYDPYLSAVSPKGDHGHFSGGYKIWPNGARVAQADVRLMCIGNSTSLWPDAAWSLELGKMLTTPDRIVAVYNGAGKGNTSSQEVLRVLRDAPVIAPDLIVSLSGICDIGYLLNAKNYPFRHKYTRRAMDHLKEHGLVNDVVFGLPDPALPAEVWCRNQRMARALAQETGSEILTFLQPIQGYGAYPQTEAERAFYDSKAKVVLKAADKPYGECLRAFYEGVKDIMAAQPEAYRHIVDLTDAFDDCPGAYRDHRHQSPRGVTHLAKKILPHVQARLGAQNTGQQVDTQE
ncbi:MAG: SGNH/GDSL hydrolase family protein [Sulfitobacter sp.]|jgi:hypothetical protein|nr:MULTISPECIES: SGNH/GDSL hydrolase family protein [unclassified Sulfitobacter]KZX97291.1 hypothetical protein A3720_18455 [Sulfitobacter sp. HI0021]KZZ00785.1 hypothetical protein A3747_20910 [Sulfitobacter sp. HI0076]